MSLQKFSTELLLFVFAVLAGAHVRHIGRYSRPLIPGGENLLDRFLIRNITDLHQVEEMIEDYATECLKRIVSFVDKYHVEQKILD